MNLNLWLHRVAERRPLVHHITNYVTVNDCANITLAVGASPVMADALEEAADIANIAAALVLNIGTLNERTVPAMVAAGKAANTRGIPVVLDPVGAGASPLRNETAAMLMKELRIAVLRGNVSEIRCMAGLAAATQGVDAAAADIASFDAETVRALAARYGCVVVASGAVDVVSDGTDITEITGGHPALGNLCGTGCMCASLIGAFAGAAPQNPYEATVAAMTLMKRAGESAHTDAGLRGTGSFRVALHDAVSGLSQQAQKAQS